MDKALLTRSWIAMPRPDKRALLHLVRYDPGWFGDVQPQR